eukprot:5733247-Pyramimonas_sp.AAC.1
MGKPDWVVYWFDLGCWAFVGCLALGGYFLFFGSIAVWEFVGFGARIPGPRGMCPGSTSPPVRSAPPPGRPLAGGGGASARG